jgi:general secretion pathway protein J
MSRSLLRDESGFTLLELVVSLGLLALMTAFMAEGISLVRRGSTVLDRVEQEEGGRTVEAHLRRTLERAVPVFVSGEQDSEPKIVFSGEANRLAFVARADGRLETGGLVLVDFRVEQSGDAFRFVTERRPYPSGAATGDPVHLLVGDLSALGFRYYGPPEPKADPTWSPRWTNPKALPDLVELTVARTAGRPWPTLVFAIPAANAIAN